MSTRLSGILYLYMLYRCIKLKIILYVSLRASVSLCVRLRHQIRVEEKHFLTLKFTLQADDCSELNHINIVCPADRAKKKTENRRRGSCHRGTMATVSEPDSGLTEEPEDTSLDREETRKRRFGRYPFLENFKACFHLYTFKIYV